MAQIKILHQQLEKSFNEGELRTLSTVLEVDYDDLPGQGKSDKARELILYLRRRQKTSQLLQMLEDSRPKFNWSELIDPTEVAAQTASLTDSKQNENPVEASGAKTTETGGIIISGGQIGKVIVADNIESVSGDNVFGDYSDKKSGE